MEQVLYKLPDGWEWKSLGDLVEFKNGYAFKSNVFSDSGIPVLRISNIQSGGISDRNMAYIPSEKLDVKAADFYVEPGDIVIAMSGATTGKVATNNTEYRLLQNQRVGRFIITNKIFRSYVLYYLENKVEENLQKSLGSAQPNLSTAQIKEIKIPIQPTDEQKRIVEKLDALLTRIDTAIENLQENLDASKSLLASALLERFHQEVNPTPIKDIFKVYNGRAYKKPELLNSGKYKVIRIQNLKGGENYYYSDLELDENKYCESGDLLFSWSGTPGTSFGAFIWNDEKAIYHYHIWKMEPKVEIAPRYAYWVLKDITEEAIANARGVAGMLHITKGTMESFIISLPSYEAQQKIAKELDELALKSEQLQAEIGSKIDSLKHLKASILDYAFKGEL